MVEWSGVEWRGLPAEEEEEERAGRRVQVELDWTGLRRRVWYVWSAAATVTVFTLW
jgi:hypothetical protein